MQLNSREILLKILALIDYKGDKENFVNQFQNTSWQNTILDLLESLPDQQKQIINSEIGQNSNPENLLKILLNYFPQDRIEKTFQDNFWKALEEMLTTVNPSLSQNQSTSLTSYLASIK